mmetsp:Transcript_31780/g.51107  ORF Transcript_31780/g.51107 Transcript_31780/m.51107 type:complete len:325 (-) Transcript_31780:2200-3174(-)
MRKDFVSKRRLDQTLCHEFLKEDFGEAILTISHKSHQVTKHLARIPSQLGRQLYHGGVNGRLGPAEHRALQLVPRRREERELEIRPLNGSPELGEPTESEHIPLRLEKHILDSNGDTDASILVFGTNCSLQLLLGKLLRREVVEHVLEILDVLSDIVDLLCPVNDILHRSLFEVLSLVCANHFDGPLLLDYLIEPCSSLLNLHRISVCTLSIFESRPQFVLIQLLHSSTHLRFDSFLLFDACKHLSAAFSERAFHSDFVGGSNGTRKRGEVALRVLVDDCLENLLQPLLLLNTKYQSLDLVDLPHRIVDMSNTFQAILELLQIP